MIIQDLVMTLPRFYKVATILQSCHDCALILFSWQDLAMAFQELSRACKHFTNHDLAKVLP
jgi:hypothetical protein